MAMRSRNIKPGFYKSDQLADCTIWARFIFPGLWMLADRMGRLEDRPRRIHAEILPYDMGQDVDGLLAELEKAGLIVRYEAEGKRFIWIPRFCDHQSPHQNEKASEIPPCPADGNAEARPKRGRTSEAVPPPPPRGVPSATPEAVPGCPPKTADSPHDSVDLWSMDRNYGTSSVHSPKCPEKEEPCREIPRNAEEFRPDSLIPSTLNPDSQNQYISVDSPACTTSEGGRDKGGGERSLGGDNAGTQAGTMPGGPLRAEAKAVPLVEASAPLAETAGGEDAEKRRGGRAAAKSKASPDPRRADFDQWYAAYPKKVGRATALASWEKAARQGTLPPLQGMLETLRWQTRQTQWSDVQYVPNPATYLNQRRWEDEPPKRAGGTATSRPAVGGIRYERPSVTETTAQNCRDILDEIRAERERRSG